MLPVGGNNVTNDVAIGVKTTLQVAEELKVRHGTCDLRDLEDEEIAVSVLGEDAGRTVSREELCRIIEARMRETFELLRGGDDPQRPRDAAGRDHPHRRRGAARGHRRARPRGAPDAGPGRRPDRDRAASSTRSRTRRSRPRVGLLRWGAIQVAAGEPMRYESAPGGGGIGRLRDAIRSIFP